MKTIIIPKPESKDVVAVQDANVKYGILVYDNQKHFIGLVCQSSVTKRWFIRSWDASMDGYEKEQQLGSKYSEYDTLIQLMNSRPVYIFCQL